MQQRCARAGRWDMRGLLMVLPGRQAGRRLRQMLNARAAEERLRLTPPDIVTPSELAECLCTADGKTASAVEAACAWMQASAGLSPEERGALMPEEDGVRRSPLGIGPLAAFARTRAELMAEGVSFADAAARCAAVPGFCDGARWDALCRLEAQYQTTLARHGLCDRDDACRAALRDGRVHWNGTVVLLGTIDLNGREKQILRALSSPVLALIPAPETMAEGFDDVGCLLPSYWQGRDIGIDDARLVFPADPTAEAQALAALCADNDEAAQITIGIGDESGAEALARRLRARGIRTRSPYGRPLSRTRPVLLLDMLRGYLADHSAAEFAALVRHPDMERWLTASLPPAGDAANGETKKTKNLLTALDDFRSRRLPERLPDTLTEPLHTARKSLDALLAPLSARRPLPAWADVFSELLETVSADNTEDEHDAAQEALDAVLADLRAAEPALAPSVSASEAIGFLLSRLGSLRLPDTEDADGVEMRGWLELALDDAPVLLLTGLHEGAVPSRAPADPVLPAVLRRHLGLPDEARREERDGFLLRVMLAGRTRVYLFASRLGQGGEPRRPSRLLFRCGGEAAALRARRFAESERGPDGQAVLTPPLLSHGARRRLPPPRPEPLTAPLASLRATGFRDYLACPYRFYLKYALGLTDCGDDADEMDAACFGELLHACLAGFARSAQAQSGDMDKIRAFLREELGRQVRLMFGDAPSPVVRLQARQAGLRLESFARWQAEQGALGWQIQNRLAEKALEAALPVDGLPFIVTGRVDRVDYHAGTDRYRLIDYKTGAAPSPDAKCRSKADADGRRAWTDLQLPLYRVLADSGGIPSGKVEVGYLPLPAESGKTAYAQAEWSDADFDDARACAEDVVRAIRAEIFWPPAAPGRYTDAFSGLCLDSARDREAWLAVSAEENETV